MPQSYRAGLTARIGAMVRRAMAVIAVICVTSTASRTDAHEGHDHGPAAQPLPMTALPRASATGDAFQAVAILKDGELVIFVDRFADNGPITAAKVTVTIGASETAAKPAADGTYRVAWPAGAKAGRHDLVVGIEGTDASDLLIASFDLPAATTIADAVPRQVDSLGKRMADRLAASPWLAASGAVAAIAALALLLARGRAGRATALLLVVGAAGLGMTGRPASAEAPAKAAVAPLPFTGDTPHRLHDGSVFLPKPTQRLLAVRTALVKEALHRPSQVFVGRVIANPNRSGLVQSSAGGRITPPADGLPKLGQAVKAGDVLAYVTPAFQAIDSANVAQTAGDLDQQIELARTKLERTRRLLAANAGTRVQAEEAELMLKGLERRRAALVTSQARSEALLAPVDGVISAMRALPGQGVAPQDILFEVIDASSLWVEALVFDAAAGQAFDHPVATMQDGASMQLVFIGRSRSLRQQSAILHFEIVAPPASLDVGAPVTVLARVGQPISAIVLPKGAVVRTANGQDVVWRHTEPEHFVSTPVRVEPFDGRHVLVQAGLASGQRIVVQGADLIGQVR